MMRKLIFRGEDKVTHGWRQVLCQPKVKVGGNNNQILH